MNRVSIKGINLVSLILYTITFILFFVFIFKIYYDRVVGFSFGDEYNSFIMGYFMVKGRALYSQIFTNHQILIAYFSYTIQKILHPSTLYKLVLYHRVFVIVVSVITDYLLILRFRLKAFGFVVFYELTKYYLFGNLFLAESLIVYPIVYVFFLCWFVIKNKKIFSGDIILAGIFTWFIIFLREPYIPVALFLYGFLIWKHLRSKVMYISLSIFFILAVLTMLSVSLRDYWYEVVVFNYFATIPYQNSTWFQIFLYPLAIFIGGKWNFFRYVLILLDINFLFLASILLYKKQFKKIFFFFFTLLLAGLRPVTPGFIFYEAFHMLVWYGLFITSIFLLLEEIKTKNVTFSFYISLAFVVITFFYSISGQSFIWEKVNKQASFTENYAIHYIDGEAIRILANSQDTLFADTLDYLLFWQAGIESAYRYGVYTFVMRGIPVFEKARTDMFIHTPPDFYYTYSPGSVCSGVMPVSSINSYVRLYSKDTHVCMYIQKKKISEIKQKQWNKVRKLGFYIKL